MDSFKSLLDKKEYDLVLSLTENDNKPEDLFYRLAAFLAKGDSKSAWALFIKNRDQLYDFNPILTIKTNFELRDIAKQYDEAYDDIPYFENKPYVSQEVEEYLRDLPKTVRVMEKNSALSGTMPPEKVDDILKNSKDDYQVLTLLNSLTGALVYGHIDAVKALLVSPRHPEVKTYALLLLVSEHYPEEVLLSKNGKTYHLTPAKMTPPYTGKLFQDFLSYLRTLAHDPSVAGIAEDLLNDLILDLYPDEVLSESEDPLLAFALLSLARAYLRNDEDLKETYARYGLSEDAVRKEAERLKAIFAAHPPLAI
jgi:hypothetical protein